MTYTIWQGVDGWYGFRDLPQDHRYIKIDGLRCMTDRKAINRAKRISGNKHSYIIKEI